MENFVGKSMGKYHITGLLGEGAMGQVYQAKHRYLEREVAIKVILSKFANDTTFLDRFEREANAIARLRHPNIVQVFDFDELDGMYYMVLELITGSTLKAELQRRQQSNQPYTLAEIAYLFSALGSALDYAHHQGIVHRDIKPSNIMLTRNGQVILTDFGIVRLLGEAHATEAGMVTGTASYMSPEQAQGDVVDGRSDVYSLGVVLYEVVTGDLPFKGDTSVHVMMKHMMEDPPPPRTANPNLNPDLEAIILRTLRKAREARYDSAGLLAEALRAVAQIGAEDFLAAVPLTPVVPPSPQGDSDPGSPKHRHPALDTVYQSLEIRVFQPLGETEQYPVELRILGERDYAPAKMSLDLQTLHSHAADPAAYGTYLGQALFAEAALGDALRDSLVALRAQNKTANIHLRLENSALEDIAWERLHLPDQGIWRPIAQGSEVPFSRYVLDQRWTPPRPITTRPVRLLMVAASPANLSEYNLDPINPAEIAALHTIFEALPDVAATYLETNGAQRPTLANLRAALNQGYDMIYVLCHGASTKRRGVTLYLEDEQGQTAPVQGSALIETFSAMAHPPRLCFFAACESAAQSRQDGFLPLTSLLINHGGADAVVAMQDKVGQQTAQTFTQHFFEQLFQHGRVDLAANEARSLVQDNWDWSVPVVYTHLTDDPLLAFPQAKAETTASVQLPPPPPPTQATKATGFVGRAADLLRYGHQLQAENYALILGMPGMGKTSLAAVLAQRVAQEDDIFWHSFHPSEGFIALIWKLAGFFYWREERGLWQMLENARSSESELPPDSLLLDYVLQTLRRKRYLLCLDDYQFIAEDPTADLLLQRLFSLADEGGIRLIITARSQLHLPKQLDQTPLAGLTLADTTELLQQRKVSLTAEQIAYLHQHTEGNAEFLILALNALQRSKRPGRLLNRLAEVDDLERYLLREMDKNLSEDERDILSAIAALLGHPGTRDVIEEMLDGGRIRRPLRTLTDRFLVQPQEGEWDREYAEHAIMRSFYYDQLSRRERREMHRLAAAYYRYDEPNLFRATLHYAQAGEAEQALNLAADNVMSFINQGRGTALANLLTEMSPQRLSSQGRLKLYTVRGEVLGFLTQQADAEENFQQALNLLDELAEAPLEALWKPRICLGLGDLLRSQSPQTALTWYEQGLAAVPESDSETQATLLLKMSTVQISLGLFEVARENVTQALSLLPPETNRLRIGALINLGILHRTSGDLEKAISLMEQAIEDCEVLGEEILQTRILNNLGTYRDEFGDWLGAQAAYQQALGIAQKLGASQFQLVLDLNLGYQYIQMNKLDLAYTHFMSSLEMAQRDNDLYSQVNIYANLVQLYLYRDEVPLAQEAVNTAEALVHSLKLREKLPEIFRLIAHINVRKQELSSAETYIKQSIDIAQELEMILEEGRSLTVLGRILFDTGDTKSGFSALEQSFEKLYSQDKYEAARTQLEWGHALLKAGQPAEAHEKLAAAQATFERLGANRELEIVAGLLSS